MFATIIAIALSSGLSTIFGYLKYRSYLDCVARIVDAHGLPALKGVDAIAVPSGARTRTTRRRRRK